MVRQAVLLMWPLDLTKAEGALVPSDPGLRDD